MSLVFEVDPSRPADTADAIAAAADALVSGGLVVFPTETVYGIACRPDDPDATARLFEAKRRSSELNLPVLAPSASAAFDLVRPNDAATRLAAAFWPGVLTLVLPRGERSNDWPLGGAENTIAVRVPDHPLSLALLDRVGSVAATSANISGLSPLHDGSGLRAAFGRAVDVYMVLRSGAAAPSGLSSTVVDLTGREFRMLREGPIDAGEVARALAVRSGARRNPHSVH